MVQSRVLAGSNPFEMVLEEQKGMASCMGWTDSNKNIKRPMQRGLPAANLKEQI